MKEDSCEKRTIDSSGKYLRSGNARQTTIQSTTGVAAPVATHQGHHTQRPGALPACAHRAGVSHLADCKRLPVACPVPDWHHDRLYLAARGQLAEPLLAALAGHIAGHPR